MSWKKFGIADDIENKGPIDRAASFSSQTRVKTRRDSAEFAFEPLLSNHRVSHSRLRTSKEPREPILSPFPETGGGSCHQVLRSESFDAFPESVHSGQRISQNRFTKRFDFEEAFGAAISYLAAVSQTGGHPPLVFESLECSVDSAERHRPASVLFDFSTDGHSVCVFSQANYTQEDQLLKVTGRI